MAPTVVIFHSGNTLKGQKMSNKPTMSPWNVRSKLHWYNDTSQKHEDICTVVSFSLFAFIQSTVGQTLWYMELVKYRYTKVTKIPTYEQHFRFI